MTYGRAMISRVMGTRPGRPLSGNCLSLWQLFQILRASDAIVSSSTLSKKYTLIFSKS